MTPAAATALQRCRAIIGGEFDPFAPEWLGMPVAEREFWLKASRLPWSYSARAWTEIPADARCALKNNLYRAARRAEVLLSAVDRKPC